MTIQALAPISAFCAILLLSACAASRPRARATARSRR